MFGAKSLFGAKSPMERPCKIGDDYCTAPKKKMGNKELGAASDSVECEEG